MTRRPPRRLLAALASAVLVVAGGTMPVAGRAPDDGAAASLDGYVAAGHHRFERIDVRGIDPEFLPYRLDPTRTVTVMIELAGPPVAAYQAGALAAGSDLSDGERASLRSEIRGDQDDLRARIRRTGGKILGQYQDAYNGLKVQLPLRSVSAVAALPGVARVVTIPQYRISDVTGAAYTAAPAAWSLAGGNGLTGRGVKIAFIDTGIDYYHADFGGSGDPADYIADDGLTAQTPWFPNAKVAGGWDFAGDSFDAGSSDDYALPQPDPDPLDCDGHGTHVAGIAAGFGVLADGSTYRGPYTADTLKRQSFLVGPGIAPEAEIYALRIFGCSGASDLAIDAIDWAVKHDMDVINMSFGSPFGRVDAPDAIAADNAAKAGIVVVATSGNVGPRAYVTSTPGTATRVISVGSMNANAGFPGATITFAAGSGETPGPIAAINANASAALPVTGPLRVLRDEEGNIALGCDPSEYEGVKPGDVVVTQRGGCMRPDRAWYGQEAGAAAVVMVNSAEDDSFPPFEDVIPDVSIPFIGVQTGVGDTLAGADGTTVTIQAGRPIANPLYRHLSDYSSAGPRSGDGALKPDIVAPGDDVRSAGVGLGTGGIRLSGTSMAAPFVTGAAALVRQVHPAWSPEQVKAALMNTADASSARLTGADPREAGAGVLQVARAAGTLAYATTGPGPGEPLLRLPPARRCVQRDEGDPHPEHDAQPDHVPPEGLLLGRLAGGARGGITVHRDRAGRRHAGGAGQPLAQRGGRPRAAGHRRAGGPGGGRGRRPHLHCRGRYGHAHEGSDGRVPAPGAVPLRAPPAVRGHRRTAVRVQPGWFDPRCGGAAGKPGRPCGYSRRVRLGPVGPTGGDILGRRAGDRRAGVRLDRRRRRRATRRLPAGVRREHVERVVERGRERVRHRDRHE